jgi:hypothetical protein
MAKVEFDRELAEQTLISRSEPSTVSGSSIQIGNEVQRGRVCNMLDEANDGNRCDVRSRG